MSYEQTRTTLANTQTLLAFISTSAVVFAVGFIAMAIYPDYVLGYTGFYLVSMSLLLIGFSQHRETQDKIDAIDTE